MQEPKSSSSKTIWIIVGVVIALLCCCLVILAAAGIWLYQNGDDIVDTIDETLDIPTSTPYTPIIVERPPVNLYYSFALNFEPTCVG